jgi:hypothetical protein
VKTELGQLVEKLGDAHRQNLRSIVLYGPAVAGAQLEDEGPKKVLVVVDRVTPAELKAAHDVADWWREVGNPLPVYFTTEEIADASDVFPLDFLDIAEVRHVLYGKDPFENLEIATDNLRHQLEYELRGRIIRLRTLYIPASRNPERLARLMADSLNSFVTLFRHVLRFHGEEAPVDPREAIIKLVNRLDLDSRTFARIFAYAADEETWLEAETNETFGSYLEQLQQVVDSVDHDAATAK